MNRRTLFGQATGAVATIFAARLASQPKMIQAFTPGEPAPDFARILRDAGLVSKRTFCEQWGITNPDEMLVWVDRDGLYSYDGAALLKVFPTPRPSL